MKILIIEDETAAARGLQALVGKVLPGSEVVSVLESVAESVEWFGAHPMPDLVFMDIHLADGESFRIFDRVDITCPIIFTTAYDRYALEAFRVNSVAYLLKPIREEDLRGAVEKLRHLTSGELSVLAERQKKAAEITRTFLIPVRDKIIPLPIDRVAFFYTAGEKVRAFDVDGNSWPMDRSLDRLSKVLPEEEFFRANRQFIVARGAVADISVWFGSRLSLNLKVKAPERIVISKDRVPEFKRWFMGV